MTKPLTFYNSFLSVDVLLGKKHRRMTDIIFIDIDMSLCFEKNLINFYSDEFVISTDIVMKCLHL